MLRTVPGVLIVLTGHRDTDANTHVCMMRGPDYAALNAYDIHQPDGFDGEEVTRFLEQRGCVTLMWDEHERGGRTVWTAPALTESSRGW
ncbi:hypothetical protein ACWGH7_30770 [Streptomyces cyaneofuscatus]